MVTDWSPYILLVLGGVLIPSAGFLVTSTLTVKSKLLAHEREDKVRFDGIHDALERLEKGQETTNAKLDRLIERSIR